MTAKATSNTHRFPPELTGDPHTDWALWELSLTLSEIAYARIGEQVVVDGSGDFDHPSDGTSSAEVRS